MFRRACFTAVLLITLAVAQSPSAPSVYDAAERIRPEWIVPHVRFLSDSALEGRDTGSRGYEIAAKYVAAQMEAVGLKPAGDHGSYFQDVRIRKSFVVPSSAALEVENATGKHAFAYDRDFIVHASGTEEGIDASGPLVFVGYGISAPAYHYDDYAGVDVRGKIAVFLPGIPISLPRDVEAVEGRVGTRVRAAKQHGAIAVIDIAPNQKIDVLREHSVRQLDATDWVDENRAAHNPFVEDAFATISADGFNTFFAGQPHTMAEIRDGLKKGPFSFAMNGRATLRAKFEHQDSTTENVVGVLPGRELPNEYVVLSAHLDHEGVSNFFAGDHVLHGALDNAGGIATILAVARAASSIPAPRRSLLFLAVTGEEKGLVGSDYFVHHPTVPRENIVADVNTDNFLWYVPVKDIAGIGATYSSLHADFADAARELHLAVSPVPAAVPGVFVLSDHFSFLSAGIPAVSVMNGEASGDQQRTGTQIWADYMGHIHHTPQDSIDQKLDWSAATTEAKFAFLLAEHVADDAQRPTFNNSAFFLPLTSN